MTRENTVRPPVPIRPLREADLRAVADLAGQLGYAASPAELGDRFGPLAQSPAHAVLVAETPGGGIAGWIHVGTSLALIHESEAEIHSLVVDERLRGRGIGAALVASAEAWARSRDLRRVRVRCQVKREDAHRFYAREGFTHQKTQHVFGKPLSREEETRPVSAG